MREHGQELQIGSRVQLDLVDLRQEIRDVLEQGSLPPQVLEDRTGRKSQGSPLLGVLVSGLQESSSRSQIVQICDF